MFNKKSIDRLPLTRKEQVKDILGHEAPLLFLINLVSFLLFIPVIALYFTSNLLLRSYISQEVGNDKIMLLFLFSGLILIPCVFIYEIAIMGLHNCLRELSLESSSKFSSFFKGIKKNFKSFLPISLLVSILIGLLVINFGSMFYSPLNRTLSIGIFAINVIVLAIILIIKPYYYFEASIYSNKFLAISHNAFFFVNKKWLINALLFVLSILPYIAIVVVPLNFVFIPVSIIAIGYISLYSTLSYLFYLNLFETNLDKEEIKEIYHKGLED